MGLLDKTISILKPYSDRNRIANAFSDVLSPVGNLAEDKKIVLKELNTFCYITATHHGNDPISIARNAGRREVYNWIVGLMDYDAFDLEKLMRDMQEANDE